MADLPLDLSTWKEVQMPQILPGVSMLNLLMLLKADSALYLIAAAYVNAVFPGKFISGLPWYFPFKVLPSFN